MLLDNITLQFLMDLVRINKYDISISSHHQSLNRTIYNSTN